jgi:methionyl-tRNA formyltransferase
VSDARIAVFGYLDVGHACLRLLLEHGDRVVAVYTHADNPAEQRWFPSVADLADAHGVPVHRDVDFAAADAVAQLRRYAPDLLFSFYYRNLLPAAVLEVPRLGAYNMHGSLLPKFRGRAPVNWAVLKGERETGATLHVMVQKADAGDIVDQEPVPIGPDDTAAEVQARVTRAAVAVLTRQIEALKAGTAPRRPQDPGRSSTFGRRRPEDGRIDWQRPAAEVHNLVRAVTHPYPGAFAEVGGRRLYMWRTRCAGTDAGGRPAGTLWIESGRAHAACGDGLTVEILSAQWDTEAEVQGHDLARALGLPPTPVLERS